MAGAMFAPMIILGALSALGLVSHTILSASVIVVMVPLMVVVVML